MLSGFSLPFQPHRHAMTDGNNSANPSGSYFICRQLDLGETLKPSDIFDSYRNFRPIVKCFFRFACYLQVCTFKLLLILDGFGIARQLPDSTHLNIAIADAGPTSPVHCKISMPIMFGVSS